MRTTKLERLSVLIEWLLLFALLATPTITLMETWSHLLGGNDLLQEELNQIIHSSGSHILNGVPLANGETPSLDLVPQPPLPWPTIRCAPPTGCSAPWCSCCRIWSSC